MMGRATRSVIALVCVAILAAAGCASGRPGSPETTAEDRSAGGSAASVAKRVAGIQAGNGRARGQGSRASGVRSEASGTDGATTAGAKSSVSSGTSGRARGSTVPADATGVTSTRIRIGMHAPLTGAAPIPQDVAREGGDFYFRWLDHTDRSIHGRSVEVYFKDDGFSPSRAVAVCKELVERHQVLMLFGFAGPDQMTACARYAASVGVPYLALSSHKNVVEHLPRYFGLTTTFSDQMPHLARLLADRLGGRDRLNGYVRLASGVTHASDLFREHLRRLGVELDYDSQVRVNASAGDFTRIAVDMKNRGIQNVVTALGPMHMIQLVNAANSQGYHPQWLGPGLTVTLNVVPENTCRLGPSVDGGLYFSYVPALVDHARFDPEFARAASALLDKAATDYHWIGWGFGKALAKVLVLPGRDLTRERLVSYLRAAHFDPGILPPVDMRRDGKFGGRDMYLLEARCTPVDAPAWHTVRTSVRRF